MNLESLEPMDPRLEQAVTEIRTDEPDAATIAAAAQRVWARLEAARETGHEHIRGCADFQALIPEYRAGRLPQARATLLKDHIHECVVCRRVYEGRVVSMPSAQPRRVSYTFRWAAAAGVVLAAGLTVWFAMEQYGGGNGRTYIQALNGTLYEVTADGNLRTLANGQELPEGAEIRTAKDSDAMVRLRDGSTVELRERSGFSTMATASDLTIRLSRGSIIVQAAKRSKGHLYVATADCRVAVTGTVFSVVSGVKGSRVSVVEGEVHVEQDNKDHVLHPGDQLATSVSIEPGTVRDDVQWSRNRERMVEQLNKLQIGMAQIHLPALRYSSRLLDKVPAGTVVFGSIPNLGPYLAQTQAVFGQSLAQSPELRGWWNAKGADIDRTVDKLRAASEYLGDEVVLAVSADNGNMQGPAFLAETTRDGFADFVKREIPGAAVETRPGLVIFGAPAAVQQMAASVDHPSDGFKTTPLYTRVAEAYRNGAGMLLAADVSRMNNSPAQQQGVSYFMAEQKEVRSQMELRATVGFSGERPGIAGWLAAPAPMASLDYVSPEATFAAAFVVKDPTAIVDQVSGVGKQFIGSAGPADGAALSRELAASLGGEFSLSFDGPLFPPSWKLVCEVYDPLRAQAALQKIIESVNAEAVSQGKKPLRTATETFEGRTYYMVAGADPNPLTEAHYTIADGYLIAGPTKALISKALQTKVAGTSITRAATFMAMQPSDHYANYSALIYENLGKTLAPLAGLLGSFVPPQAKGPGGRGPQEALAAIGDMKPLLIAAYADNDRITVAANGNMLAKGLSNVLGGNLLGVVGGAMPMRQMQGAHR